MSLHPDKKNCDPKCLVDQPPIQQVLEHNLNSRQYCPYVEEFLKDLEPIFARGLAKDTLYKFTKARIVELNLYNIDPYDVFLEGITRGIALITNRRELIKNPKAWLRRTIGHILCEEARKIKKVHQLSEDGFEIVGGEENEDSFSEHPAKAWQAFRSLSKSEKRIIIYKLFQGRSYEEISQFTHYKDQNLAALRKQYSRAIKNLRHKFQELS